MKTYLRVPYSEKDSAKGLGARFDMGRKRWYCPDGIDLLIFARWLSPEQLVRDASAPPSPEVRVGKTIAGRGYVACDREHSTPPWERCGCQCEFGYDRARNG